MFGEYMDESYFESGLDYNGPVGPYVPPCLGDHVSPYDADYSSDFSYDDSSKLYIHHEEPHSPRLHDTAPEPTMVYRARSDIHQHHSINGSSPFTITHWEPLSDLDPPTTAISQWHEGIPDDFPTFEQFEATTSPDFYGEAAAVENTIYEPLGTNCMSIYEKLTGSRRTSSTIEEREKDRLTTLLQPSGGVIWTHSYGPFDLSSSTSSSESTSSPPPSEQGLGSSDNGHPSRADEIARIPVTEPISSVSSVKGDSWIPVVPHCENMKSVVGRKADEWDFSLVVPVFGDTVGNVAIKKRYRVGMKGFLRLN
jgi:hypothetical protein